MRATVISRRPEEYFTPNLMKVLGSQHGGLEGGMVHELADFATGLGSTILPLGKNRDYVKFGRAMRKRTPTCEYSSGKIIMYGAGPSGDHFERAAGTLAKSNDPADAHLPSVLLVKMATGIGDREREWLASGKPAWL